MTKGATNLQETTKLTNIPPNLAKYEIIKLPSRNHKLYLHILGEKMIMFKSLWSLGKYRSKKLQENP
jgi:hypothetical protein